VTILAIPVVPTSDDITLTTDGREPLDAASSGAVEADQRAGYQDERKPPL
jgi:hypothetical protein